MHLTIPEKENNLLKMASHVTVPDEILDLPDYHFPHHTEEDEKRCVEMIMKYPEIANRISSSRVYNLVSIPAKDINLLSDMFLRAYDSDSIVISKDDNHAMDTQEILLAMAVLINDFPHGHGEDFGKNHLYQVRSIVSLSNYISTLIYKHTSIWDAVKGKRYILMLLGVAIRRYRRSLKYYLKIHRGINISDKLLYGSLNILYQVYHKKYGSDGLPYIIESELLDYVSIEASRSIAKEQS